MMQPGSIPTLNDFKDELENLRQSSDTTHREIEKYFFETNNLYNTSSVMEDIVLGKYLSLMNTAKSIETPGISFKGLIIESFTSEDYVDKRFPIDFKLSLDTQNGDLTLPAKNTTDLKVKAVIIENDSNGIAGNAFAGGKNADISVITQKNSSSYFEYEKITSNFNGGSLYLGFTLKLDKEEIANSVYVKLFVSDEMLYPKLDLVEVSLDGKEWTEITKQVDFNKADYYIRFLPKKIRFIRLKLSQRAFATIKTSFGNKNRYLIGIREVSVKRTEFTDKGEYVSVPFSGRKMNTLAFNSTEISNGDISYSISANNGTKWVEIKRGESLDIQNQDFGLRENIKVDSIRVKIDINRYRSPASIKKLEYQEPNSNNKYFLKNNPIETSVFLGGYISKGSLKDLSIPLEDVSSMPDDIQQPANCPFDIRGKVSINLFYIPYTSDILDQLTIKINGMPLKNDNTIYSIIPHDDPKHSILVFARDKMPSGNITACYKPYVHDHRYALTPVITLPSSSFYSTPEGFSVKAIIFEPLIDLSGNSSDGEISSALNNIPEDYWSCAEKTVDDTWWATFANQDGSYFLVNMYTIAPQNIGLTELDYSDSPRTWVLEGSNSTDDSGWIELDKQDLTETAFSDGQPRSFSFANDCLFKKYRLTFSRSISDGETLAISSINLASSISEVLTPNKDYTIIDKNTIEIARDRYNTKWDYQVMYFPSVNITCFKSSEVEENSKNAISLNGAYNFPNSSKLCFEYNYQDSSADLLTRYYTPICNEYRIYIP